jgi:hypothetical protein
MSIVRSLGFASLISITALGCSSQPPGTPGDDGDGGGGGSGGGGGGGGGSGSGTPQSLDASGTYKLLSIYDVSTNMPGTVGTIVNDIIAATDDPNDPTQWVLQLLVNQLPIGTVKTLANDALPFVSGYLNNQLLDWAPTFVTDMKNVGQDFGDIAKKLGVNESYVVVAAGEDYTATDTATGVHFTIGTVNEDFAFSDYSISNVVVNNVGLQMDQTAKITIAEHQMPLAYGKILRIGLDAAIIPLIDSNATNLGTFFADEIDCNAVGQYVEQAIDNDLGIDLGSGVFVTACTDGLTAGANAIYSELEGISATALNFDIDGTAKGVDTNSDYKIDQINTGTWDGTLSYSGGSPAPLSTATFTGSRM